MVRYFTLILVLVGFGRAAVAQQPRLPPVDTARVVELRLSDSTTVVGRVIAEDLSSLTLITAVGARVNVPLASLVRWTDVAAAPAPIVLTRDPSDSRLFLAHTARSVPRGKGYVLDYLVFLPVVSYGVTDRLSLTGGMSLVPGLPDQLFYVAPKYSLVESPSASFAAGVLYLRVVGFLPTSGYAGIAYGVTTLGNAKSSATVLVGFPFASGGWEQRPLIVLGGETRVSQRVKLLFEGWRIPGSNTVPAVGGLRLIGTHVSWDFGLLFLLGNQTARLGFLPWVDFVLHW
jgi:hypothetical protein